jgi:hypothetical protein
MPGADAPAALRARIENTQVSHHRLTGSHRHSLRNGFNGLFRALPGEPGFVVTIPAQCKALSRVDASVGASVAPFPKFVCYSRPTFTNFGKLGATAIFNSRAACDFEVPTRNRGKLWRNFKIGGAGTTRLCRPLKTRARLATESASTAPCPAFVAIASRPSW